MGEAIAQFHPIEPLGWAVGVCALLWLIVVWACDLIEWWKDEREEEKRVHQMQKGKGGE